MTPKEHLQRLNREWLLENQRFGNMEHAIEDYKNIEQALTELEELKRYPTADEVCKALGELIGDEVRFINGKFCYLHKGATSHFLDSGVRAFTLEQLLKVPHLITLIGRFYEGLEKVGKEE